MSNNKIVMGRTQKHAKNPIKKMGDFIEPGTHRSTIIRVKIETILKKSEMYFSYCIESKDFIYAFFNCSIK